MHKFNFCIALVMLATILLFNADEASAECCYGDDTDYCRDGSGATPYCGHGKCNIFGCSCRGGCRRGNRGRRDVSNTIHPLDLNQDGRLDMLEAHPLAEVHSISKRQARDEFDRYDLNGDGYLDQAELDI